MAGIAFFDLDRTILDCNSATLWVKRQVREGRMKRTDALKMAGMIVMYQLGSGNIDRAVKQAIRELKGQSEAEIRHRTEVFWEEEVVQRVRPGARPVIEKHRLSGDKLVLLTGSSTYLSRCASDLLEMDDILCTQFESIDGIFTGEGTLCYGTGKRVAAQAYLDVHGARWDEATFYTDSFTDISVMEMVGRPVAVHPDPRLLRRAKRENWTVADWGTS